MAEQRMKEVRDDSSALKHFFGKALLQRMGKALELVHPSFDAKALVRLHSELESHEMKRRVQLIREELKRQLPSDYNKALALLLKSLKSETLTGFDLWPYTDFVQTYGLEESNLLRSLKALAELTKLFTAEFAVRPFLIKHPSETLAFLETLSRDKNVHLRRWASEGTRPRLPWGERLQAFVLDPRPTLPILDNLKFDEELYVRKSVSNHLNDIAKDHPDYVIKLLARWKKEGGALHRAKIDWIISRSLRTLIKEGHPAALDLIGVKHGAEVKLSKFAMNQNAFEIGDRMEFNFVLLSQGSKAQKIVIDYIVHFAKAKGKTSQKVFKLKTLSLAPGQKIVISKSHHLKKVTTRSYYSGAHRLAIQVNGVILKTLDWSLTVIE